MGASYVKLMEIASHFLKLLTKEQMYDWRAFRKLNRIVQIRRKTQLEEFEWSLWTVAIHPNKD